MTGWSFLIALVVRADVTKVHFEGGVVQFKIGQRAVIDGVPSYAYENIGAKLRRNALMLKSRFWLKLRNRSTGANGSRCIMH
jgi:hypothetical protein